MSLLPCWHEEAYAVEHQLTEGFVVFRQIVDLGWFRDFGRAYSGWLAVEVSGALDLEGKLNLR